MYMYMEKRELTCIGCPLGCTLEVCLGEDGSMKVAGNTCGRGDSYARKEVLSPARTVTTTVRISGRTGEVLAVRTQKDIPKDQIFACMRELKDIQVKTPVPAGDVVVENIAGTGVDIVATKTVL